MKTNQKETIKWRGYFVPKLIKERESELKTDPEAIKKAMQEQRERRTVRVKSKLP